MKKKTKTGKSSKRSLLSGATEDAEAGGLPEGRVKFSNTHTQIVNKANYDGKPVKASADGAVPVLSSTCTPVDKKNKTVKGNKPFNIHLSGGSIDRIHPDKTPAGVGFVPAPESKARGLSRSCNAQLFLNSLEDAGVPPKLLKAGDYTFMDGMVVELVRLPQPKRRNLTSADDEDSEDKGYEQTYPAVSEIYEADFDVKAKKKKAKADEDEDEDEEEDDDSDDDDDDDDDDEEEEESDDDEEEDEDEDEDSDDDDEEEDDDDEDSDEDDSDDDEEGDDDSEKLAEKFGKKALADPKAKKKGIAADDFYTAVFPLVKSHKDRKNIMKHIKNEKWARSSKRPWSFDKKAEKFEAA